MIQYKDPEDGILKPIPASGYLEIDRMSAALPEYVKPYENFIDRWSYCPCNVIDPAKDRFNPTQEVCNKYKATITLPKRCVNCYMIFSNNQGPLGCFLSKIDEVEMVKQTSLEWLPTLLGTLKTELGMEALEKRLKDAAV